MQNCDLVKYTGRYWQAKMSIVTSCRLTVMIEVKRQSTSGFSWWRDDSSRDSEVPATGALRLELHDARDTFARQISCYHRMIIYCNETAPTIPVNDLPAYLI
jgi:hypothetical protein